MARQSFFGELRHLAATVDRETSTLQQCVDERSDPASQGSAMLVLREVQQDINTLMKDMEKTLSSLKSSSLITLAEVSKTLVQKQKQQLNQIEEHLSKYGYKAPVRNTEDAGESEEEEEDDQGTYTILSPESTSQVQQYIKSGLPTTPKTPRLEDFGISQERLQQIHELTSRSILMSAGKPNSQATQQNTFKMPTSLPVRCGDIRTPDHARTNRRCEPDIHNPFETRGVVVTPGIMGGRQIAHMTPKLGPNDTALSMDEFASPVCQRVMTPQKTPQGTPQRKAKPQTPQYLHHPNFKAKNKVLHPIKTQNMFGTNSPRIDVTDFDKPTKTFNMYDHDKSPTPPRILSEAFKHLNLSTTPEKQTDASLKPVSKNPPTLADMDTSVSPELPVFQTPGLKNITKADYDQPKVALGPIKVDFSDPNEADVSPVPPVLFTPGVKQIKQIIQDEKVQEVPKWQAFSDDDKSPTPPELLTKNFSRIAMEMYSRPVSNSASVFAEDEGDFTRSLSQTNVRGINMPDYTEMFNDSMYRTTDSHPSYSVANSIYMDPATPKLPPRLSSYLEKENIPPQH